MKDVMLELKLDLLICAHLFVSFRMRYENCYRSKSCSPNLLCELSRLAQSVIFFCQVYATKWVSLVFEQILA